MRRRFRVIPFHTKPANPDPHLDEKLRRELPGIAAWAMEGAAEWYEHGLGSVAIIEQATDDYVSASDTVGQWIAECANLEPGQVETAAALWAAWSAWARVARIDAGNRNRFGRDLTRAGLHRKHTRAGKTWRGIRLRRDDTDAGDAVTLL